MSHCLKILLPVVRPGYQKARIRSRSVTGSATAAAILEKVVVEDRATRPKVFALFPWREVSLPHDSSAKKLYNIASVGIVLLAIGGTTISGTVARSRDFIIGGEAAFRCATDSIFYHDLMQKHRQQVKVLTTGVDLKETKDVADLRDIFGVELQAFYRHAIEQHCLKSTYHCTYSLQSIHGLFISKMELLKGIPIDRNEHFTRKDTNWPGVSNIIPTKFVSVNRDKLSYEEKLALNMEVSKYMNTKESTVRVWLDVECTEVFAIKDMATGNIVQGSMEPRQVTHQILMENVRLNKEKRYTKEWTITDIDNWLEGNQFWIADKLHPPSSSSSP